MSRRTNDEDILSYLENSDEELDYCSDLSLDPFHASDEDDPDYEVPQDNRHDSGSSDNETLENINRLIQYSQPQQIHVDEELFLPQNDSDQRDFDDIPMNIAQSPNPIENQVPSVSAVSVSELSSQNSPRSDPHEHLKTKDMNNGWCYTVRDLQRLPFTAEKRLGVDVESHSTVESIFCYIIDDEFLDMMVEQTNIYAVQISSDAGRLARWKDVD
ncbi:unnamed protein product [Parnassius apollo]|uniref:(apollo) hypothetical protein n=1 Tax=Parnassius apollo TaxID=110799 RepID=A0A8S3Y9J5_PARAO|nr:unnamed protein product [Parnassius apollo]